MLQFQDGEVKLNLCFGLVGRKAVAEEVVHDFTALLHERLLLELIGILGHLADGALQFPQLGKGVDDGEVVSMAWSPFKIVANIYKPRSVKALKLYLLPFPEPEVCFKVKIFDLKIVDS